MKKTILLAEDDKFVRNFVSTILNSMGYFLLVADCAESALERIQMVNRLDLLIADLALPDMSGAHLFERVYALHPEARPLFISGYNEEEARVLFKKDGFDGCFLGKPFLSRELLIRIEEIFTHR